MQEMLKLILLQKYKECFLTDQIECGDGWFKLIMNFCNFLIKGNYHEEVKIIQIKKHLKKIRIYTNVYNENVYNKIKELEERSLKVNEITGYEIQGSISMVECMLWEYMVAGSNPVFPKNKTLTAN